MKFWVCIFFALLSVPSFSSTVAIGLKVGDKAPDFTLTDPTGKQITLSSLQGKIVLIDFWASWCGPCRQANPELVQLYKTYNSLGFEIFSVSLDTKKEAWVNAIKNDKLEWANHGSELKGWEAQVAILYSIVSIPSTFLLNENGVIIAKDVDEYDLERKLNTILLEQVYFYPQTAGPKLYFTGKAKYQIEDLQGNVKLKGKGEEIDISQLEAQEYVIKYEDKTEKFIKRKSTEGQGQVTFFPQRADDVVTLSRESEYEIYNQRGKLIKKGSGVKLEVNDLPTGLYYLSSEGNVSTFFKK